MRNVSFRFAGAKPGGKAMSPQWPDRALFYLEQTVRIPIQWVQRRCPSGLGFASNVHLVLGKKSKCEEKEEGKIILPLLQRHPNANAMSALSVRSSRSPSLVVRVQLNSGFILGNQWESGKRWSLLYKGQILGHPADTFPSFYLLSFYRLGEPAKVCKDQLRNWVSSGYSVYI